MENQKGNGGVYDHGAGKARATYAVFCANDETCGELVVAAPLYTCDKCDPVEVGVHHDFLCPLCGCRWNEFDKDLKPV